MIILYFIPNIGHLYLPCFFLCQSCYRFLIFFLFKEPALCFNGFALLLFCFQFHWSLLLSLLPSFCLLLSLYEGRSLNCFFENFLFLNVWAVLQVLTLLLGLLQHHPSSEGGMETHCLWCEWMSRFPCGLLHWYFKWCRVRSITAQRGWKPSS